LKLIVIDGPMQGQEFFLTKSPTVIGRKQEADICLASDAGVANFHCRIIQEGNDYFIEDMMSSNGTWINDKQIHERTPLPPRAIFRVGQTYLGFMHDQDKQAITTRSPSLKAKRDSRHAQPKTNFPPTDRQ
jgi:pSer/pThr/pTyr-binding forkhead associated (FHA) protein